MEYVSDAVMPGFQFYSPVLTILEHHVRLSCESMTPLGPAALVSGFSGVS